MPQLPSTPSTSTTPLANMPTRMRILGHRGASAHLPENTLASYIAAIQEGAEGIESDIHKSKDDRLLMFHDPTLDRTTDGTGKIRDQDWTGQIEHVRTKAEPIQPIPLFEELVDLLMKPENRHVILNIDVKIFSNPDEIFPLMHDVISSYPSYETDLSPRLILGLWHPLFIAPAQRYLPSLTRFHIGLSTHIARKYFWDHMDGFSIAFPMLTSADGQAFLRDCKAAGKGIMTWTVNEERDMQVARTYGVEWLITDRVGFAVEKRQEWENDPSVLQMGMLEYFRWSWLNWKHYSIPQSMFLRYFEENLTRNAFKPGPLEEVGAHRVPAGDDLRVEAEERATKQSEGILVDVGR